MGLEASMRRRTLLLGLASLATTGLTAAGRAEQRGDTRPPPEEQGIRGDFRDTRPPEERGVRGDSRDTRPPEEKGIRGDFRDTRPPEERGARPDKGGGLAPPDRTTGSSSGNSSVGGIDKSFGGSGR
jgi:hypothetical protein